MPLEWVIWVEPSPVASGSPAGIENVGCCASFVTAALKPTLAAALVMLLTVIVYCAICPGSSALGPLMPTPRPGVAAPWQPTLPPPPSRVVELGQPPDVAPARAGSAASSAKQA